MSKTLSYTLSYSYSTFRRSFLVLLALVHTGLVLANIFSSFPTRDEIAHIPAGLCYLMTGEFHVYRVNPPLTRLVQALPVLLVRVDLTGLGDVPDLPAERPEWELAKTFARNNRDCYQTLVTLARLPGIAWSLLGMMVVAAWCQSLHGDRAGLLGAMLWCFDPNVLAHAAVATPDLPCAVLLLTSSFLFGKYLHRPTLNQSLIVGGGLGLAVLAKFTALLAYLIWPAVLLICVLGRVQTPVLTLPLRIVFCHGIAMVMTSVWVINLGYGFEGTGRRLGDFDFASRNFTTTIDNDRINIFRNSCIHLVPVPLPANLVRGLDLQQLEFEGIRWSFLRGEWRLEGWWYFYLYATLLKVPLGSLSLGVGAFGWFWARSNRGVEEWLVWLSVITVVAVASLKTGYTMHFRYILPALPLLIVAQSKLAASRNICVLIATLALALWSVGSSVLQIPRSLSYFNEIAGGPVNGGAHLIDSNLEWGQEHFRLKQWIEQHSDLPMYCVFSSSTTYWIAGLHEARSIPLDRQMLKPGYYAVDSRSLVDVHLEYFRLLCPIDAIGYTIRIYLLTDEDIFRLCQMSD